MSTSACIFKPLSGRMSQLSEYTTDLSRFDGLEIASEDEDFVPDDRGLASYLRYKDTGGIEEEEKDDPEGDIWQDDWLNGLDIFSDLVESRGYRGDLTKRIQDLKNGRKDVEVFERSVEKRRENWAKDKVNRATVEQVLDPRTRMILFKLLGRGKLTSLRGCVSTGKEANVYYGTAPRNGGTEVGEGSVMGVAVKVFKTSILHFKDRGRYVDGEFRFRRGGYNRSSPRKMVQQWTEKEFRNLSRLQAAGIPAPEPLIVKAPVLVMSFFGKDGWPAPRLKDAVLSIQRLSKCYDQVLSIMKRMWKFARLVHGDLSEYNLLYDSGKVVVIDVSQSVEGDHPMALDFLRRDCVNINEFFRKSGVDGVLSVREVFDYVTSDDGDLETLRAASARRGEMDDLQKVDDAVFTASHIPRRLAEVTEHEQVAQMDPNELIYGKLAGLVATQLGGKSGKQGNVKANRIEQVGEAERATDDEDDDHDDNASADEEEGLDEGKRTPPVNGDVRKHRGTISCTSDDLDGHVSDEEQEGAHDAEPPEMTRKEWKKKVKAEARERRQHKTPKHEKKRKKTLAKRRKGMKTRK